MSGGSHVPPRLASWLVMRVVPTGAREAVLGDLHERWAVRLERDGAGSADRWYWRQVRGFLWRMPVARALPPRPPHKGGSRPAAGLASDIRLAARTLGRRPGLTLTAMLVLALAVGANTTVFTVVDAVLLQRLPYPGPERLVMLWDAYPQESRMGDRMPITMTHYQAWTEQTELFSAVGAWESTTPALQEGDWAERIDAAVVSPTLLPMLGARPAHGRLFRPEDGAAGAEPVVILSHGFWASRFGGDPGIVGRTIVMDGTPTRVVGVLTDDFWFYDPYSATRSLGALSADAARLWQPLPAKVALGHDADYPRYRVVARVRGGLGLEAAAERARAVRHGLPPTTAGDSADLRLVPLTEQVVAEARPRLLGLFGAVSLVLLIACVNLVSLLLVHLESRRSELAVRSALGAGRGRIARQLVVESTLLALCGGVVGLLVSVVATEWLLDLVPRGLPLAHRAGLNPSVAAFGVGLSALTGMAIGSAAALKVDPTRLAAVLSAAPRTTAGARSRRLHGKLVTAEVAFSLVLLISATLLLSSLLSLQATDTGFDARGVLTFQATLVGGPPGAGEMDFFAELESEISAMPGVVAAGATSALPFSRWVQMAHVAVDGSAEPPGDAPRADHRLVSPGYFRAIGLRLVTGREFGPGDREGGPLVAIVNQAFVDRRLDGDPSPLGRTITVSRGQRQAAHTIVGVVANVKHNALIEDPRPTVYAPVRQSPLPFMRFAVRVASGDPLRLVESIRRVAAEIDPAQPLHEIITFEALVAQSIEQETFYAKVVAAFAGTAVLLTLIGIYGVVSYATRQRDREIAVRIALGADAGRVGALILRQGLIPVGVGLALGCLGAVASAGLLRGLLHGMTPYDLTSYAIAVTLFAVVAAAACVMPARRAAGLDPMSVMRES